MRVKPPLPALVALVSVTALSGCASGYQYVKNDDLGFYARVPDGWAVYDETDIYPDASERDLERLGQMRWVRTFHGGDDQHDVEASRASNGPVPAGVLLIRAISAQDREELDLRTMRGGGDPNMDPLTLEQQPAPNGQTVTVLQDEPVEFDGGFSGVHTVYAVEGGEGGPFITEQTVLRNSRSTVMYFFVVSCSDECYSETYRDEIQDFVDSWTIQEVQS
jgi:hypothetical protein